MFPDIVLNVFVGNDFEEHDPMIKFCKTVNKVPGVINEKRQKINADNSDQKPITPVRTRPMRLTKIG